MQTIARLTIAAVIVVGSSTAVIAGSFDGWCFMEDVCTGPSKIENDVYDTCEETCVMKNPTSVNGMDGLLYNVVCEGDHLESPTQERMLFLKYKDYSGKPRALAVGKNGSQELARCR